MTVHVIMYANILSCLGVKPARSGDGKQRHPEAVLLPGKHVGGIIH